MNKTFYFLEQYVRIYIYKRNYNSVSVDMPKNKLVTLVFGVKLYVLYNEYIYILFTTKIIALRIVFTIIIIFIAFWNYSKTSVLKIVSTTEKSRWLSTGSQLFYLSSNN